MPIRKKPFFTPTIEDSTLVFEESLIKIQRDTLRLEGEQSYRYYSLSTHPFAVVILATTKEGLYVLNEEYRHPTKKILLGCPGGYINAEEDPLKSAERELEEETGFQAGSFTLIGSAYPYAGVSGQKTLYVKATEAYQKTDPQLEPSEIIRTVLLSHHQIQEAVLQGKELDGTLCTALFFNSIFKNSYHRK